MRVPPPTQNHDSTGYYLYGLTLQCASWDRRLRFLREIPYGSKGIEEVFPALQLEIVPNERSELFTAQPGQTPGRAGVDITDLNLPKFILNSEVQPKQSLDIVDARNNKYYMLPMYVSPQREVMQFDSLYKGFVGLVPVRIDNETRAGFWVKRGSALICHKAEAGNSYRD